MHDKFETLAHEWDNPMKKQMTEKFIHTMLNKIDIGAHWRAFEIGAGTGLVGLNVMDKVNSIVFEDTSAAMLSVLQSKLTSTEKVTLLHAEVFEYKAQDIDLVFSCMAFHHIPEIEAVVKHLYSITKLGAKIVIGDLRSEDGSFHNYEPIPHLGFDTEYLKDIFTKEGFEVIEAEDYNTITKQNANGDLRKYAQFMLIATRK